MRDWRNALRSQPTYKIGNRTFTFRLPNHVVLVMAALLVLIIFFYLIHPRTKYGGEASSPQPVLISGSNQQRYNSAYPLTAPVLHGGQPTYRIAIIADMDTNSKSHTAGNTWLSYLKLGHLSYNRNSGNVEVSWDGVEPVQLASHFALKGEHFYISTDN